MNKKILTGALAGVLMAGGVAGMAFAQTAEAPAITEEQAIEIALTQASGEVQEVDLEREDGQRVYEVEILGEDGTETEIEISAATGEVLDVDVDSDDDDDDKDCDRDKRGSRS